jgi:hypothetical protein
MCKKDHPIILTSTVTEPLDVGYDKLKGSQPIILYCIIRRNREPLHSIGRNQYQSEQQNSSQGENILACLKARPLNHH